MEIAHGAIGIQFQTAVAIGKTQFEDLHPPYCRIGAMSLAKSIPTPVTATVVAGQ